MAARLGEKSQIKKKKKEEDYLQINLLKSYEEIKKNFWVGDYWVKENLFLNNKFFLFL